jgi:hypothetical protein
VNGSRSKFFSKEMRTPTRRTGLPKHVSDLTTQVGHDHPTTEVLLVLGTNKHLHLLENAAELATRAPLGYTGQAGEQHRSDRSLLEKPENFHRRPLHRSGWCSTPIRPVQARKLQIHQIDLPSSELNQTRNGSHTRQHEAHQNIHPSKTQQRVCTGQTGVRHWSGRCDLSSQDEQHLRVNSPKSNSRSPKSLHGFAQDFGDSRNTSWVLHIQDFVHQNLLN